VESQIKFEFFGFREYARKGEYIISVMSPNHETLWSYLSPEIPIFDFALTKIFQVEENGLVEVRGMEKDNQFFFSIYGAKVKKVYDFS
jgi:hypothetical protein